MTTSPPDLPFLRDIRAALVPLSHEREPSPILTVTGAGALPSVFAVTDLLTAAVGAAGLAAADLIARRHTMVTPLPVQVDRRLVSLWCRESLRPEGWSLPPAWDAIAGDYRTADGWIRLHTNAPRHRAAALAVLEVPEDKAAVTAAVARWAGDALETAVVAAGGCAAAQGADENSISLNVPLPVPAK